MPPWHLDIDRRRSATTRTIRTLNDDEIATDPALGVRRGRRRANLADMPPPLHFPPSEGDGSSASRI
jgi:hypothetical protein